MSGARIVWRGSSRGPSGPLSGKGGVTSLAVVGTDHLHVVDLVTKLSGAGADVRVIVPSEDRIGPWLAKQFPDVRGLTTRTTTTSTWSSPPRSRANARNRDRRDARRQERRSPTSPVPSVEQLDALARGARRDGSQVHA